MSEITPVQSIEEIPDLEDLITLIGKQLSSYGSESGSGRIRTAVLNALKEESRAVFFLWSDYKERLGAFAFANINSGLESGADYLWINELFVDEMFRKRGVASQILNYIETWAVEQQIVYTACSTSEKNHPAMELYKRNGFNINNTIWIDKNA